MKPHLRLEDSTVDFVQWLLRVVALREITLFDSERLDSSKALADNDWVVTSAESS